jgi:hypothetical protein
MSPLLAVSLFNAVRRIGLVSRSALEQRLRDEPVLLPFVALIDRRPRDTIRGVFQEDAYRPLVGDGGRLQRYWDAQQQQPRADVEDAESVLLFEALSLLQIEQEAAAEQHGVALTDRNAVVGGMMVAQWASGAGPVNPATRILLTVLDVGLEYVAANPAVVGAGHADALVGALAQHFAALIPDAASATDYGPKARFGERLAASFLRAGLQTALDHPGLVYDEPRVDALVRATLPPLVAALPATLTEQARWRDVTEALLGSSARAALATVARRPMAFLGARFDPEQAVGALTVALLKTAATQDLLALPPKAALLTLHEAVLDVAAERPGLLLARPGRSAEAAGMEVYASLLHAVTDAAPSVDPEVSAHLLATAIDVLQAHGALLQAEQPWEQLVTAATQRFIAGMTAAARAGGADLQQYFTHVQLVEVAHILFEQGARSDGMLSEDGGELARLVGSIAAGIAADERGLLTRGDWLELTAAIAEEVARNPNRLVSVDGDTPGGELVTRLLRGLLRAATADAGRARGGVLRGETLKAAVASLLQSAVGQADAALKAAAPLEALATQLSALVRAHAERFGSEEWLHLYDALLPVVLAHGEAPQITLALVDGILAGDPP